MREEDEKDDCSGAEDDKVLSKLRRGGSSSSYCYCRNTLTRNGERRRLIRLYSYRDPSIELAQLPISSRPSNRINCWSSQTTILWLGFYEFDLTVLKSLKWEYELSYRILKELTPKLWEFQEPLVNVVTNSEYPPLPCSRICVRCQSTRRTIPEGVFGRLRKRLERTNFIDSSQEVCEKTLTPPIRRPGWNGFPSWVPDNALTQRKENLEPSAVNNGPDFRFRCITRLATGDAPTQYSLNRRNQPALLKQLLALDLQLEDMNIGIGKGMVKGNRSGCFTPE
ncbi:hypothetical protein VNO77_46810 [Canavalia gladiata]|uniref:Uncharacterized protein n=1 Tax=Canavalia gladiata TaxID=3824 RepID=A0AAN9JG39_CANGL